MDDKETLEEAIVLWGIEAQFDMVVEECAELINAIQKHKRGRVDESNILEEAVDVDILLDQVKIWSKIRDAFATQKGGVPSTYLDSWNSVRRIKMDRLKERILKVQEDRAKVRDQEVKHGD
jgi:hypothetical protein